MDKRDLKSLWKQPHSSTCFLIDFDKAQVVAGPANDMHFLIVAGEKPWVTMNASLQPRIYVDKPDYWQIEVVGRQSGVGLPTTGPYSISIDLSASRGRKGVEVVGAAKTQRIDITG